MTSRWTRIVPAAAAIITIAIVSVTMLNKSATKAYAIEQTVEANRGLSFVHFRIEPTRKGNANEAWAQFGDDGELLHMRAISPDSEDGPKDTVWQAGKAEVWLKAKNMVAIIREPDIVARMGKEFRVFTPTVVVDELMQEQAQGRVRAETTPSADGKAEIRLIVQESPDRREIYHIDPGTKLLQQIEKLSGQGENEKLELRVAYLDYNQAPPEDLFTLNPPANVMRLDQATQDIGLLKGELTDEQIAAKVAREFFEAVIAGDFAKAGRLFEGLPAEKLKKVFSGNGKILRVVSIAAPTPHEATRSLQVSCQIEIEVNGHRAIKTFHPFIRPVYNQPDRWGIIGGI